MTTKAIRSKVSEEELKSKINLKEWIAQLPPMVEETFHFRTITGQQYYDALIKGGQLDKANIVDLTKEYNERFVKLKEVDHNTLVPKIFAKKGANGLKKYYEDLVKQSYYIAGKYPQFAKTVEPKSKFKVSLKMNLDKVISSIKSLFKRK
ncbi:MAG: hypothetical protein ABI851_12125 [Saprospiraceae bacterium]